MSLVQNSIPMGSKSVLHVALIRSTCCANPFYMLRNVALINSCGKSLSNYSGLLTTLAKCYHLPQLPTLMSCRKAGASAFIEQGGTTNSLINHVHIPVRDHSHTSCQAPAENLGESCQHFDVTSSS